MCPYLASFLIYSEILIKKSPILTYPTLTEQSGGMSEGELFNPWGTVLSVSLFETRSTTVRQHAGSPCCDCTYVSSIPTHFFRPVFFSSVSCMIEFKICERCSVAWYAVVTDCFKVYSATYQGRRVSISSTGAILGDGVVCPGSFMSTRANFPLPLPPVESAPMPLTCNMRHSSDYCGGSAVGRWTCDLQVAGSIPAAGGFHVT